AGMDPDTPAAVIEKGTTADQRIIRSTLSSLEEDAKAAEVITPAIIVVGKVVSLTDCFNWRQMLPLAGVRAIVTRPKELSSGLASMLRERGAEAVELPTIEIEPICGSGDLTRAIEQLNGYDWIVFTSPSGVRVFMSELLRGKDIRSLSGCRIAAIGSGSEKELLKYGLRADMVPSEYDGRTLGAELAPLLKGGDRVLIPRAKIGNRELIEELSKVSGVSIDDIPTYDTIYNSQDWFDAESAFDDPRTYALFTSASTVRGFVNAYPDMDHSKVRAVCIGKQTRAEADSHGMETYVSDKATLVSLVSRLEDVCGK
ncbi:MAG: uroporphyrinogen-III C-methyltransferase, partial [Clostridiales bacterium]|nr:uroporphyrinogen-III C-methyltransferase [Clostridiales bacterium]